jgi:two-component system chemotaxis response regulator CheB
MPKRDIVVVGASAGGVEALSELVAGLPATLQAAVFVVLHLPPAGESHLPRILSRAGALGAVMAQDGDELRYGRILVAPPDHHLLLTQEKVRVVYGPRENHFRPAVDPLFRSAALAFGPRVIGVVLTGALNDGASGLVTIKRAGGLAVVQDPETAAFPSMPNAALHYVDADACLPVKEIGSKIEALSQTEAPMPETPHDTSELEREVSIAGLDLSVIEDEQQQGTLVPITCPECHGPLWEISDGGPLRYRCRVGHGYTAEAMDSSLVRETEDALWAALNTLEESANLYGRLAAQAKAAGDAQKAVRFAESAQTYKTRSSAVRKFLDDGSVTEIPENPE